MRRKEVSSESDLSDDENQFKVTANPRQDRNHVDPKYDQSSESDISSVSEEQEEENEKRYENVMKNNKQHIQHQSQSDSQSQSQQSSGIDHIEQRIKRLENDLEEKIDKQKNNQSLRREQSLSNQKKPEYKLPTKSVNPPLPNKKIQQNQRNAEGGYIRSVTNTSENKNNINISAKNSDLYQKRQDSNQKSDVQKSSKQKKSIDILQKEGKNIQQQKVKQKTKQNTIEPISNALLKQANLQIGQMQKAIDQLRQFFFLQRKENLQLKEQLIKKEKKQKKHQTQEIKVLKMGADCQNLKLQKLIQTLKALESLQKKLKKSIVKKQKEQGLKSSSVSQLVYRKI